MRIGSIGGSRWLLRHTASLFSILRLDATGCFQDIHIHRNLKSALVFSGTYTVNEDVLTMDTHWQSRWRFAGVDRTDLNQRVDHREEPLTIRSRILTLDDQLLELTELARLERGNWTPPKPNTLTYGRLRNWDSALDL